MSTQKTLDDLVLAIPTQYYYPGLAEYLATSANCTPAKEQCLWSHIQTNLHQHATYFIWHRWLNAEERLQPSQEILSQSAYWRSLVHGLRRDDRFVQKFCLALLLRSIELLALHINPLNNTDPTDEISNAPHEAIFHFKLASKAGYVRQYHQFCELFAILSFSGYANQVKDALATFPDISIYEDLQSGGSHEKSFVTSPFWTALFQAALNVKNNTPGVCDLFGTWLLSSPYTIQIASKAHAEFITGPFLDWAGAARLFTSTVTRSGSAVCCSHAQRLAAFVSRWVSASSKNTTKTFWIDNLVRALHDGGTRSLPLTICVLQGIAEAVRASDWKPPQDIVEALLPITRIPELSTTQRLLVTAHCRVICKGAPRATELSAQEKELRRLLFEPDKLVGGDEAYADLERVEDALHAKMISRGTLQSLCRATIEILVCKQMSTADPSTWHRVICALWTESDLKEHPRDVTIMFTQIVLHPALLIAAIAHRDLQGLLSKIVLELYNLATGRPYLWNSFCENLQTAVLEGKQALEFLRLTTVDIFERFAKHPPSPKSEYLVELALSDAFVDELGKRPCLLRAEESYGYACMFDILNRLQPLHIRHQAFGRCLLERLLSPWVKQLHSSNPVPAVSRWKTTAQLQMIILLEDTIAIASAGELARHRDKLLEVLSIEPMPRFRFLLEWIVIKLFMHPKSTESMNANHHTLNLLAANDQSRPKFTASLVKICTLLCIHANVDKDFAIRLLTRLVVLSASSRVAIRHEAQWHFPLIWKHAVSCGWHSITTNPTFSEFYKFIESLEKYQDPPRDRLLTAFDPTKDIDLRTLFEGGYLQVEPMERPLCTAEDFERATKTLAQSGLDETHPRGIPIGPERGIYKWPVEETQSVSPAQTPTTINDQTRPDPCAIAQLQTKAHDLLLQSIISRRTDDPCQLIVIASLIDNPHNLGGLCRVSEVFGAQEIHLPSLAITKDKAFRSVSVTSELHLSLVETPSASLPEVLRQKMEAGFALVGIEQTNSSTIIPSASDAVDQQRSQLPAKCVLILGAERTGIPASILAMVDRCLEIQQWGVIRSLNVQTAAAIVCYEWRRVWAQAEH